MTSEVISNKFTCEASEERLFGTWGLVGVHGVVSRDHPMSYYIRPLNRQPIERRRHG